VTTIGRHPDSSVFLDDVTVSRRHAEIRLSGSEHELRDAGSLNGTYVNGKRVDTVVLAEGDQVQIGKFKLVFVLGVPGGDD
jgi:pSer/pThr/pTyr-binding forkhead associated (FHA) protein